MPEYIRSFLEKLQHQDPKAFAEIYEEYANVFYRYIKTYYYVSEADIQDLLADIFVKIRTTLPTLDPDASFSGLIWTIAKNHIIDYFKKSKEIPFSAFDSIDAEGEMNTREDSLQDPENFLETFEASYTAESIQKALDQLDTNYKDPLFLKFIEEQSYEEIAETLGLSQDTVRQRVSRGLKKLTEMLEHLQ